jgi:hypothetical protein
MASGAVLVIVIVVSGRGPAARSDDAVLGRWAVSPSPL